VLRSRVAAHGAGKRNHVSDPPVRIDEALVRRLVAAQFPAWAHLPVVRVSPGGWDNRTFRLGAALSVRLPSAAAYAAQAEKEQRWLPRLAPLLPLPIPALLARGAPGEGYPWPWSVLRWLKGDDAAAAPVRDLPRLATDLGGFLGALQRIDTSGGPPPGPHSFFRGAPLAIYEAEARDALRALGAELDARAASAVLDVALASSWTAAPVWVHGDVAASNLLVRDGRLGAVIDFGCAAVGDPACDLAIAWTFFAGVSRAAFRAALPLDAASWARGRGWALWKAAIELAAPHTRPEQRAAARRTLDAILASREW
jgi:aminoglycoside phosphotransferase (APT) family kinase protein